MEYKAVRYPTKEYRQYRPGSKGLNVHYRAFREQFYGNKAIIKYSFRDVNRNPSVGQYTDQRGIPTYAYKIPNGRMYKTAPLMDRIPRGGSVPRIVGSLGDVQGSEFFQEGTYQPPAAPGSTLNSPYLFGKTTQVLQDAAAQYQAQTGKPVNAAVVKSKEFQDFYIKFKQNWQASHGVDSHFRKDIQISDEISNVQDELPLVNPAINTDQTPQPVPDTVDTPMMEANYETMPSNMNEEQVVETRFPVLMGGITKEVAKSNFPDKPILDAGNRQKGKIQNNTLATSSQQAEITNSGPPQVMAELVAHIRDSLYPLRVESAAVNDQFNRSTEQQITDDEDEEEFDDSLIKAKGLWTGFANKLYKKKNSRNRAAAIKLEIKNRIDRLIKPDKKGTGRQKNFTPKGSNLKFEVKPEAEAEAEPSQSEGVSSSARRSSVGSDKSVELGPSGKRTIATLKAYVKKHKIPFPDGWPKKPTRAQWVDLVKNWEKPTNKVSYF